MNAISLLNTINSENPNLMMMSVFFVGKANELSNLFKNGNPDEQSRAYEYLSKLDVSNLSRYKQDLQ